MHWLVIGVISDLNSKKLDFPCVTLQPVVTSPQNHCWLRRGAGAQRY